MEEKKKSGFATAGLVLGIIGVCTSFIPIVNNLSFIMGILAIIFGIIAIKKAGKAKVIVTIILGVLAIYLTYTAQQDLVDGINDAVNDFNQEMDAISGNSTEEILANNVDVNIGEFVVKNNGYYDDTKLTVTVKNKSTERKNFSIHIEAIDENGARIDEDYVYANDLGAGQSQDFETFNLISSDKIKLLKKATFRIVEVSMY